MRQGIAADYIEVKMLRSYLRDPINESGRSLPFSRLDVLLCVLLSFALMVALSYSAEGLQHWTPLRIGIIGGLTGLILLIAPQRRLVLAGAFGVVALRLALCSVLGSPPLPTLVAALFFGSLTYFLSIRAR
jgi:hypothetical protein